MLCGWITCIIFLQGEAGIFDISTEAKDGFITCTFKREVTSKNDKVFNLDAPYYLLLGVGHMHRNGKQQLHHSQFDNSKKKTLPIFKVKHDPCWNDYYDVEEVKSQRQHGI